MRRAGNGFTLVEALIALTLLAVAAVSGLTAQAAAASARARLQTAGELARLAGDLLPTNLALERQPGATECLRQEGGGVVTTCRITTTPCSTSDDFRCQGPGHARASLVTLELEAGPGLLFEVTTLFARFPP